MSFINYSFKIFKLTKSRILCEDMAHYSNAHQAIRFFQAGKEMEKAREAI